MIASIVLACKLHDVIDVVNKVRALMIFCLHAPSMEKSY